MRGKVRDNLFYDTVVLSNIAKTYTGELAFNEIGPFVDYALETDNQDDFIAAVIIEVLITLSRASDTTEIPIALSKGFKLLIAKYSKYDNYCKRRVGELTNYYRYKY